MANSPFSARCARVRWVDRYLTSNRWTVNIRTDELDATNFEDCGFVRYITGPLMAEGTIEGYYSSDPGGAAVNVGAVHVGSGTGFDAYPGLQVGPINLFLNAGIGNGAAPLDNLSWLFPQIVVTGLTDDAEVKGIMKYTITFRNQGTFTPPAI